MKSKCNHDCFNCTYDDCIIESISSKERKEIKERDKQYFTPVKAYGVMIQRPVRAKHRGRRGVA